ncbi:MAG: 6-hydroxymethylpterin diphosphokinase MptE-like protein, partial [Planctomycetota bacterium]|nr:6-hydroxymethylpterin diphosphokinase MptE-like protein [Planctomycetota bacterium]
MSEPFTISADDLALQVRSTPSEDLLRRNLAALCRGDDELVRRILDAPDEDLEIETADDGHPTATWRGRRLASARRPGEETRRQLQSIDPREIGLVGVVGLGLGQHVAALARRFGSDGIVLVAEPDLALIRAVFSRIDATPWLHRAAVRLVDRVGPADLAPRLSGAEGVVMIGVRVIEHPASRARVGDLTPEFARGLREIVDNARMNLVTTLLRCAGTVENQLANLPLYAASAGVADLEGVAAGRLGVVVSAGPSLRRNIGELTRNGVRDRCVIIATQTTLKPLLEAGVAPHYVTALDYHEISRRFYEGIDPGAIQDVELVVDPKVNPVVPEAWPGRIRCIPSPELDRVLGPHGSGARPFPPCATVAHLCHALARHLGCDPVALVGQDLGFSDHLYYGPGNAIHDIWAPELGDFNTIETMEWERIVRHRGILSKLEDVHGRAIHTDVQMLSYLRTFEERFQEDRRRGLRVVDATEGGVRKAHTETAGLADTIAESAGPTTSVLRLPPAVSPADGREKVRRHLEELVREVEVIGVAAREASSTLERMREDQDDSRRMERHFKSLETARRTVESHAEARFLTDLVNQIGVYKRQRADRLISIERPDDPRQRQRLEIDRDLVNVEWTGEASSLLSGMLQRTIEQLDTGVRRDHRRSNAEFERSVGLGSTRGDDRRVVAVVPIDPDRGGTGGPRRLDTTIGDRTLLPCTLERLGRSTELASIVLLVPGSFDVERLIDRDRVGLPVECRRFAGEIFDDRQIAFRAGRANAPTAWRGGIHGLTVYDEVLAPAATLDALRAVEADAAVLVGPDWTCLAVEGGYGVDEVVRRFKDRPELPFVFVQAPPGIGSCLVTTDLLSTFAGTRSRLASIGYLLGYRPDRPEGDPIAQECCVVPPASVRDRIGRFIPDSAVGLERIRILLERHREEGEDPVSSLESGLLGPATDPDRAPSVLRIELGTERIGRSPSVRSDPEIHRPPMTVERFRGIVAGLNRPEDVIVVLDGVGDPLRHPDFDVCARIAVDAGVRQVRIRS